MFLTNCALSYPIGRCNRNDGFYIVGANTLYNSADMELLSFINFLKVHTIAAGNNNNRVFNFDDYVLLVFTH